MAAVRRDHVTCEPAGLDLQCGWIGLCSRLIHLTAAKTNMKFARFTVNTRSWATVVPRLKKYLLVWFFFKPCCLRLPAESGPPLHSLSSCLVLFPLGCAMKGGGQEEGFSAALLRRPSRLLCCCLHWPLFSSLAGSGVSGVDAALLITTTVVVCLAALHLSD